MKTFYPVFLGLLLIIRSTVGLDNVRNEPNIASKNETTYKIYLTGVELGIINPEKYPFIAFRTDEQNVFKDLYDVYISTNGSHPINYQEWLVLNNFGILADTHRSLLERKIVKRSTADTKRKFLNTVKKGDILVVGGRSLGGLIGHAAIMTTDDWVLEMPGGSGWHSGISDNNRKIRKDKWFDKHASDSTTVYRCPDRSVAAEAATWVHLNYYNPNGGFKKTIHVKYKLTTDIWSKNPSYCSKLVIHGYYFGTGSKKVIKDLSLIGRFIVPAAIPLYFLSPYKLVNMGQF